MDRVPEEDFQRSGPRIIIKPGKWKSNMFKT
jgi:hypothetical protein